VKPNRIGQIGIPAAIISIVAMMVVPIPAAALDFLLVLNLAGGVVILLSTMFVQRALDFSVFPSLLLVATMFRLALNVSSVRLVLLDGYAGEVIESFGHVVIGGSLVVGLVIFLILVVIQFVVITNGAGRVAEVGARFTLDAMPGKQMAIDADLAAGIITEDDARRRRREVAAEADFYGAMDGASKFVKGDAIAAIVITVINLIGGFVIGVMQRGMSVSEAAHTYSLLTVGDGLVSQIPALLISIASGLIVTRAATENDLGSDVLHQLGRHRRPLRVAAAAISAMILVPGLPKIPFLLMGGVLWFLSSRVAPEVSAEEAAKAAALAAPAPVINPDSPEQIAQDMRVEALSLEIGYGLMDLVDAARGGDLLDRVRALRRKVALEIGIVMPPMRTRDNVSLGTNAYAIKIHGVTIAQGEAPTGMAMVLGPLPDRIPGTPTIDPVFGLEAAWIPAEFSTQAGMLGCTVIDRASVITAHLNEVLHRHAAELLSRQDVKALVETVKQSDPVVVDELQAANVSLAEVQNVLCALLNERVPIRDLVRILEVVSERARVTKDHDALVEAVRAALGPAISAANAVDGELAAITLDPLVERRLAELMRGEAVFDPNESEQIVNEIVGQIHASAGRGESPVIVCSGALRASMKRLLRVGAPTTPVMSYAELGDNVRVQIVGVVQRVSVTA
jgi:flagellar biosynthesis protein FlhA